MSPTNHQWKRFSTKGVQDHAGIAAAATVDVCVACYALWVDEDTFVSPHPEDHQEDVACEGSEDRPGRSEDTP